MTVPEQRPPVPAVPSVVLALGSSLQGELAWLEQRFRTEIGSVYPSSLLRFRLFTRSEQLAPETLHVLCDPLLVHPLWLALQERGLAPAEERGPQLNVYAIVSQDDNRGCRLLAPLQAGLDRLYEGRLVPSLRVFFVGTDLQALPALAEARRAVPCFVLGPVKQLGYRTSGRHEPFETIRLALNALLASSISREIDALLQPDGAPGLSFLALGAAAIAVARPHMETWLRNTLLQRLTRACLQEEESLEARQTRHLRTREEVTGLFELEKAGDSPDEPDELWEKDLGRQVAGLFPRWANELLDGWGIDALETRRGHWRLAARSEGDLYRHLQQILSELAELQEDAQVVLSRDIIRLASGLRRHFERHEQAILARWAQLLARSLGEGRRCLAGMAEIVATTEAVLNRARDALQMQRLAPLWLRGERDIIALADILAAQMMPVRSAAERARQSFLPPGQVALRLLPFVLLLTAAGADLQPGGLGLAGGALGGLSFAALASTLQYRRLSRETQLGARELCRLYEDAIGGLMLGEARNVVQHLQEALVVAVAQLRAVSAELGELEAEASRALEDLSRFPRENTYLERQLSDPVHCAQFAEQVSMDTLLEAPAGEGAADPAALTPGALIAATVRGSLPAAALGAGLVEAVGRVVAQRGSGMLETRVEELLVAGVGQPFSAEGTMEGLHRRALPLWCAEDTSGQEVALVVLSREAAMAFQGWLAAHAATVRVLPTLQRDRISYLRCRRLEGVCPG